MKHEYEIRQSLYNWVQTLPIDGQSGESIVTVESIQSLQSELEKILGSCRETPLSRTLKLCSRLWRKFLVRCFSTNLFQTL